jgi:hypothetical protein
VLKEVDIAGAMRVGGTFHDEEFTTVPRLLCCPPMCKYKKDGIEEMSIDARTLPAGVEVTRIFLCRYEAAVEIDAPTPGTAERA